MRTFMKLLSFCCGAVISLTCCDQKPKTPLDEYGDSLIGSYRKGQVAGEMANLDAVKKAVDAYHAMHDTYPASLDNVRDLISGNIDLSKYDYNPETGAVAIRQ